MVKDLKERLISRSGVTANIEQVFFGYNNKSKRRVRITRLSSRAREGEKRNLLVKS